MSNETRKAIYLAKTLGDRIADTVTSFVGSWLCIALHTVWFIAWLMLHLDINLLTLIVSLEAIYLATVIMMSQNRQGDRDRLRDDTEAREVDEMATNGKLLHSLVVDIKAINEKQSEILEALQVQKRGRVKP